MKKKMKIPVLIRPDGEGFYEIYFKNSKAFGYDLPDSLGYVFRNLKKPTNFILKEV